jgi:hypothetical protein
MSIPKLPFSHLPLKEKVRVAEDIVSDMTGHPDFPFPNPSLSVLAEAARELNTVVQDSSVDKPLESAAVSHKARELENMISLLLSYVYKASGGDPQKYLKIRHLRESKRGRRQKRSFTVKQGLKKGDVILRGPHIRSGAILWEMHTDPLPATNSDPEDGKWRSLGEHTSTEYLVEGLESDTRVWFRMARVDKFGRGPFSTPASVRVP